MDVCHYSRAGADKLESNMGLKDPANPGGRLNVSYVPRSSEESHHSVNENLAEMFINGFTHFLFSGMIKCQT